MAILASLPCLNDLTVWLVSHAEIRAMGGARADASGRRETTPRAAGSNRLSFNNPARHPAFAAPWARIG